MHMGYYAANNIHQRMQNKTADDDGGSSSSSFLELAEVPPMIGLAVGKKAVSYWPEGGVTAGEEVTKLFFGDDLGFSSKFAPFSYLFSFFLFFFFSFQRMLEIWSADLVWGTVCWNHLGLGGDKVVT
jgi:hypothetical protein